ncbi:hypothetical protein HFO68_30895 [Rhizobium laguerreae]|uniref:hypothetical protein n=1 Tax=Rhizobium laguerreae TaxID=1076926 RepID=UPI001C8FBB02|nr:hypothetical protein [Rhizobium laguerreae]MBY3108929.1 hypothetical protein [Rhizobium laguerreae]
MPAGETFAFPVLKMLLMVTVINLVALRAVKSEAKWFTHPFPRHESFQGSLSRAIEAIIVISLIF